MFQFRNLFLDDIYSLSLAPSLPTLPFEVFRQLLDSSPLTTDDGMLLRRMVIEVGAMHLILNCLSIFTHHSPIYPLGSCQTEVSRYTKRNKTIVKNKCCNFRVLVLRAVVMVQMAEVALNHL